MFIKSKKARDYEKSARQQMDTQGVLPVSGDPVFTKDVAFYADLYYKTRRPDLDPSLILDCLQGFIYENDRQVKEIHVRWHLDPANPRAEITVEAYDSGR